MTHILVHVLLNFFCTRKPAHNKQS